MRQHNNANIGSAALVLLLLLLVCSCGGPQAEPPPAQPTKEAVNVASEPPIPCSTAARSFSMSMYNLAYVFQALPVKDKQGAPAVRHVLLQQTDTVFDVTITNDSVAARAYQIHTPPADSASRLGVGYQICSPDTARPWVRTNSLYTGIKMRSAEGQTTEYMMLKFKYLGAQTGQYWINVY